MEKSPAIYTAKVILTLIGFAIFIYLIVFFYQQKNNETVSKNFVEQLYSYPAPPHTELLSKQQVNGKQLVSGNGGYWGVVASVHYSTTLSPKEVLAYYEKAGLFHYPKSQKKGVELELYMAPNTKKVFSPEGNCYEHKARGRIPIRAYRRNPSLLTESNQYSESHPSWDYVIQLTSDFDYALNFD
ncbi:hypothetical protein CN918_30315 [Priestia megaterium]|nr:hypothetical protein CN918_30315 [Priestia megaterium]